MAFLIILTKNMSGLIFLNYDPNSSVKWNINNIMQRYFSALVDVEMLKFEVEYDKKMFREKMKNIDEFEKLIEEYQHKLSFNLPGEINRLKAEKKAKKKKYDQIEERYMKKHHLYYYNGEGNKFNNFRAALRSYRINRCNYLLGSKGNYAYNLDRRYYIQEKLIKQHMRHEFWRRIEEGQRLQEEMLAPSVEKAIRRYRATHG